MVSQNNDGNYYEIAVDTAKEGAEVWSLNDWFKARVGDDGTPLVMRFYTQGQLNSFDGHQKPIIQGNVGAYSFDDQNQIVMAADAKVVSWTGDPSDMLPGGRARFRFPQQMFPTEGAFYGFVGYVDESNGRRLTGVNVWFRVLGGVAQMGKACDYYISDLDIALANAKEKMRQASIDFKAATDSALQDLRTKYQQEAQANQDASETTRAGLLKLADSVGAIQAQIDAGNVVTLIQHNADIKRTSEMIENKLAQMSLVPEAFANADAIKEAYPNGKTGIMVAVDTGHKWIWDNGQWNDCGVYQSSSALLKINTKLFTPDTVPNGYKDLNTFPMNEIVSFSGDAKSILTNLPDDFPSGYVNMTVITYGYDLNEINNGTSQTIIASDAGVTFSHMYFRSLSKNSKGVQSGGWVSDGQDKLKQAIRSDKILYTDDNLPDNLKDLNNYPMNAVVSFSGHAKDLLTNLPNDFPDDYVNMSVMTYGFKQAEIDNGTSQTIIVADGERSRMYFRALSRNSKGVQSGGWINDGQDDLKRAVKSDKGLYTEDKLPDELKDFNTYPMNSNISYSGNVVGVIKNAPQDLVAGRYYNMGIFTLSFANSSVVDNGTVQYLSLAWSSNTGVSSATYARTLGRNANGIVAPAWQKLSDNYENGSLSLFSKIGVIGDSFASGCIAADGNGNDRYQISWPQIMGRNCGAQVTNFTHGGANTGLWTTEDYGMAKMKAADPQDLYILALGINDAAQINRNEEAMGSINDVGSTTSTTFYRYYSDIIKAIQDKAPHACIIMTTLVYSPMTMGNLDEMNAAIKELADYFKIPCIDLQNDPFFISSFYANGIQGEKAHSHPTAPLYAGMAKRIQTLIENDMVVHKNYYDQFPWGHPSLDAPKISVEG